MTSKSTVDFLRRRSNLAPKGATLLEILVALMVLAVLAGILIPGFGAIKRRAEKARCIGNLRTIHAGFDGYLLDKNQWPQLPQGYEEWEETRYFKWWIQSIEPYGVGREVWLCPSDKISSDSSEPASEYHSTYAVTHFNPHQYTPYRWQQPWAIERGNLHGKGAHILMPDGSITTSQAPWGER